jgi:hypothetical protein
MITDVRAEQFLNPLMPIDATPSGMVIAVRPVQPSKAELLILVMPAGSFIEVSLGQSQKAPAPTDVAAAGIFTAVSAAQLLKASSPMPVTEYVTPSFSTLSGMVTEPE